MNIAAQDAEGKTCLHWAAESYYPAAPECIDLLFKKQKELLETKVRLVPITVSMVWYTSR